MTGAQTTIGLVPDTTGVAFDAAGNLFVTFIGSPSGLIKIDPVTSAQTIFSDGGFFQNPVDIAFDDAGGIVVVDSNAVGGLGSIVKVDPVTGAQTLLSSGGLFANPVGTAADADR